MVAVKDYFDPKKRDKLLLDAIKKSKGKGEFPFAFGLSKTGGLLAIDFRDEHGPDKFLKEIKKTEFKDKFIVGKASIKGKVIEMKGVHNKNKVKPKEVKDFLAALKTTVTRAIIDGKGDDDDEPQGKQKPDATSKAKAQVHDELKVSMKEIDKLLAAL